MITVGGKHVIFNLMQALINPGDEVIIPVPYWVTYKDVVNYAGGKCVFVDTDEAKGFTLTAAMIEPHLTRRTKMVIINSPSNPSGAVLDRGEFEKIFQLTSTRGIYLMTDECYCKFLYDSEPFSIASLPGAKETVLVAGSLSKTYAMTGWRIGFGLVPGADRGRDDEAAEPLDVEPDLDRAEGGGRSAARSAGIGAASCWPSIASAAISWSSGCAQIPGVTCAEPRGAFYAYPNIGVALGQERHRQHAAVLRAAAGRGARRGGAGRSVRDRSARAHLLRHFDARSWSAGSTGIHQFIVKNS